MKAHALTSLAIILSICCVVQGCMGTPVRFSEANQHIKPEEVDFSRGRTVSATESGFQLLLFFPININNRHERAFESLRKQAGDAYLTNIKIEESWTYAFVGTVYSTKIQATAYPYTRSAPGGSL